MEGRAQQCASRVGKKFDLRLTPTTLVDAAQTLTRTGPAKGPVPKEGS